MSIEIEAENLTKVFGQHRALRGVNLKLDRGESLTIIGPNGAGKTTLLRCLAGLSKPSGGRVLLLGRDLAKSPEEARRGIGFVSHETLLYGNLTATENLLFYGRMYDVADLRQRVEETLDRLGLVHRSDDPVRTLSRGMRQRLAIGRALLHRPSVVLLDEPHTGLDVGAQEMLDQTLDRSGIYVAKMLGDLIFLSIVEAIVVPLFWVLYNMSGFPWPLALIIPLGTVGFVAAGTLFSAMTVGTRAREVLLPILLLPGSVPLIAAAAKATGIVLTQDSVADAAGWIRLLVACDVVFFVLSILTFEYVLKEPMAGQHRVARPARHGEDLP